LKPERYQKILPTSLLLKWSEMMSENCDQYRWNCSEE